MEKVLVLLPVTTQQREEFLNIDPDLEIRFMDKEDITTEILKDFEVIIGNVPVEMLKQCPKLKWLQLNSAGADSYVKPGALLDETMLTNASGAYGLAISEHMLAMVLALKKRLFEYHDNMKQNLWQDRGNVTSIFNCVTLVVGLGDIGNEFAKRMHALGSTVYGIRRNCGEKPDYLEGVFSMEQLDEILPKADVVALSLPGTKETYQLFDQKKFALMKESAILINAGRGNVIAENDLYQALRKKQIWAAALDVTETEPLPKTHPLWQCENLLLTPHVAGGFHLDETLNRIVFISIENLKAYAKKQPLNHVVNREWGY